MSAEPEVYCNKDFPRRCTSSELRPGEKAPFRGILVTPEAGAFYHTMTMGCQERIDLEIARTSSKAAERWKRDMAWVRAEQRTDLIRAKQEGREEAELPWYRSPFMAYVYGAATAVAIFYAVSDRR